MFKLSVISTNATYLLTRSNSTANEGTQFTINLTTTGVQNGQAIPFAITGAITTDDFVDLPSLTGNFIVQNGFAQQTFSVAADALVEGTESFLLTITLPEPDQSVTVDLLDTTVAYATHIWHMDGTAGATTTSSTGGIVITGSSSMNLSIYAPKFGPTGFALADNFGVASSTPNSDLTFTGDFTIEFFNTAFRNTGVEMIIKCNDFYITWNGQYDGGANPYQFRYGASKATILATTTAASARYVHKHIAITREGTTLRIFIGGVLHGTATGVSQTFDMSGFSIGGTGYTTQSGYVDELRTIKNLAMYTANFTPPTAPFTL